MYGEGGGIRRLLPQSGWRGLCVGIYCILEINVLLAHHNCESNDLKLCGCEVGVEHKIAIKRQKLQKGNAVTARQIQSSSGKELKEFKKLGRNNPCIPRRAWG